MSSTSSQSQNSLEGITGRAAIIIRSRVLTACITTATGIVLVRILPKADLAVLSLLLFSYELTKQAALLGLPESVFYFFGHLDQSQHRPFVWRTMRILVVVAAAMALVFIGLSQGSHLWLGDWRPEEVQRFKGLVPWVALVLVVEIPTWVTTNVLLATNRAKQAGIYHFVTSAITVACLMIPLLLGQGVEHAVAGLVIYALIRAMVSLPWLHAALPKSSAPLPPSGLREQFKFGGVLGVNQLVARLNKYLDVAIISALLPAVALAEYKAATYEIPFVNAVPFALSSVLITPYVRYARDGERDAFLRLFHRSVKKVSLALVPCAILFALVAPQLIPLVYGEAYSESVVPFQIFTLIVLFRVTHWGSPMQAYGDTAGILRITGIILLLNLILSTPMTIAFGIRGTALGTLLANAMGVGLYLRALGKHLRVPAHVVLPARHYMAVLGLSLATGAAVWTITNRVLGPYAHAPVTLVLLQTGLFLLLYLLAGSRLGLIRKRDWRALRALLGVPGKGPMPGDPSGAKPRS